MYVSMPQERPDRCLCRLD